MGDTADYSKYIFSFSHSLYSCAGGTLWLTLRPTSLWGLNHPRGILNLKFPFSSNDEGLRGSKGKLSESKARVWVDLLLINRWKNYLMLMVKKGLFINITPLGWAFRLLQFLGGCNRRKKITKNRKLHCQRHDGAESDYLDDIRIWVLKALRKYWHVSVKTQVFWQPCQNGKMAGFKATLRSTWIFNRVLRRNNISHRRSFLQVIVCIIERVSICVKLRKWACILLWQGVPTVHTQVKRFPSIHRRKREKTCYNTPRSWIIFRILTCCRFEWALFSVKWNLNETWQKRKQKQKV